MRHKLQLCVTLRHTGILSQRFARPGVQPSAPGSRIFRLLPAWAGRRRRRSWPGRTSSRTASRTSSRVSRLSSKNVFWIVRIRTVDLHSRAQKELWFIQKIDSWATVDSWSTITHAVEFVSQKMKLGISPLAKLDCFCTRKKIIAFTLSWVQTSWRGGLILGVSSPVFCKTI